jgi:hypothetical protein
MELIVEIPVGIEAEVIIPSGVKKYSVDGKEYDLTGDKLSVVAFKSGKYKMNYTR